MLKQTLLVLSLLLMAGDPLQAGHKDVFLFAGQSNMAGADAVIDPGNYTNDLATLGIQTEADRNSLLTVGAWGLNPPGYPWGDIRGHTGKYFDTYTIGGNTVKN